ncbi:MAG: BatA domain-containing protein [Chloroflexi bacterium]|nr:BatA domain-containing protein [Chloroflexota bacterium]
MSFLAPLAFLFLGLVPVLVVLYLLKVRRQDQVVGSTFLWRRLTRDVTAHEPWQRLRWSPLLLLQLVVLLLLVVALARPALQFRAQSAGFEVLVVSVGASTGATDVRPTRFAVMKATAQQIIDRLPAGSGGALIAAGATPLTLVGDATQRSQLTAALDRLSPAISSVDMRAAIVLAVSLAQGHANSRIDVVSDGVFKSLTNLPDTSIPIHFERIAGQGNNEGVTALSARPQPALPERLAVFVRVNNYGTSSPSNRLTLLADGKSLDTQVVTAKPGSSQDFVFNNVPRTTKVVTASLSRSDALEADNQASLVLQQQVPPRVLLVTTGNRFLLTALHFLPVNLFEATPQQLGEINPDLYDVIVFDGTVPPILPHGNFLFVDPPNSPLIQSDGLVPVQAITNAESGNALLSNVDLRALQVRQAEHISVPSWAQTVVSDNSIPILLEGQAQGHRIVVLPFALQQSNLPLLPAFPILISNIIASLAPTSDPTLLTAASGGRLDVQPLQQASSIVITRPDGRSERFSVTPGQTFSYARIDEAGVYTVEQFAKDALIQRQVFAANLLDARQSDISLSSIPKAEAAQPAGQTPRVKVAQQEWWLPFAVLGFILLLGEWWWFHRQA